MISFRSKVAVKILDYFFLNPNAQRYINELARTLAQDPKNVEQKLKEFERKGLLRSEFRGRERYFFLVKNNPLLSDYRSIFLKTYGIEKRLKDLLRDIQGLKEAYLFGSYAQGKMDSTSDIDILAVGAHSVLGLQRAINNLQQELGREFNVINLSEKEFLAKKNIKGHFIRNVFKTKTIRLI